MPDLRDSNYKKNIRKKNRREARKYTWISLYPVCMMVVIVVLLAAYGFDLKEKGYECASGNSNPITVAFTWIGEGVYPWNAETLTLGKEYNDTEAAKETDESIASDTALEDKDVVGAENEASKPTLSGNTVSQNHDVHDETEALSEGTEASGQAVSENETDVIAESVSDNEAEADLVSDDQTVSDNEAALDAEEDASPFSIVDASYFDDACFIGDSRMVGLSYYSGLTKTTFLAKTSMTIYKLMDSKVTTAPGIATVRDGLTDRQYGKIYIMVGINEIGTGTTDYFIKHYKEVVEEIRELQPEAKIFIQGILHVTKAQNDSHQYINNININDRNRGLKQMAEEIGAYYIDVNSVYDDEDGNLPEDMSGDMVHLLARCYAPWCMFLLTHGVQ